MHLNKVKLNSGPAKTNSAMIRVLVLSAKVRRNERLWHTLDIGNMFRSTSGLKIFNSRNKFIEQSTILFISIILHMNSFALPSTSLELAQSFLSDWLWVPLL